MEISHTKDILDSIPKVYSPAEVEKKWRSHWEEHKFFQSQPDKRTPYTIVIPPPNVTGVLHMGHMLNSTIQDVLIRRKRMTGFNACWVPGTDHASIATETKVVNLLREKGIKKSDIGRDGFLKEAFAWKEKYGDVIINQLKDIGASCDFSRTRFTMEPKLSEAVISVFVDLFQKGYIYRGLRMINWDPQGKTALSDEEVIYKESQSKLYHLRYPLVDNPEEFIVIATTRPETILADTAVAVNPTDERYKHLIGRKVRLPFINREIPIIADEYVEKEFGTGCLKVTPAHDPNDYEIGKRHNLEVIDIMNDDGTFAPSAQKYIGLDRFEVRKKILEELKNENFLVKIEEIANKIGRSERTDAVVEPRLSLQWFLNMQEITAPALQAVLDAENNPDSNHVVHLIPKKFVNTYRHWLENIRDWCISRQLWWGHQIPAYYYEMHGENTPRFVVAKSREEAYIIAGQNGFLGKAEDLKQDEDVLDTWFSSWLWPIAVFDGITEPDNPDYKYYYPTNDLITAPDILFFWVARMIIAGLEYTGKRPFQNVYLTGIVRDKQGRKMSKSLGNSPDTLELIRKFGADGVRMGLLLCSPAGNDLLFDEALCEQGRNFCNKVWNSFRLIKSLGDKISKDPISEIEKISVNWIQSRIATVSIQVETLFEQFKLSEALMSLYKLIWDDFCAWYLELIKPAYNPESDTFGAISEEAYNQTLSILEELLMLIHPITPFLTEEIWSHIKIRTESDCITISQLHSHDKSDSLLKLENEFDEARSIVTAIRGFRSQNGLSPKESLEIYIKTNRHESLVTQTPIIKKLANISKITIVNEKIENSTLLVINTLEIFVPFTAKIDIDAEKLKIQEEINYLNGFLESVEKKLNNEKFVSNAKPDVLAKEVQKKNDALAKLEALKTGLMNLN